MAKAKAEKCRVEHAPPYTVNSALKLIIDTGD